MEVYRFNSAERQSTVSIGSLLRMKEGSLAGLPCACETAFIPAKSVKTMSPAVPASLLGHLRDVTADMLTR